MANPINSSLTASYGNPPLLCRSSPGVQSFPTISKSIRRQTRTLYNRLRSIHDDAAFVRSVAEAFDVPVVTNSRAGDWYVDPVYSTGKVYFKSTDGHYGQWKFSRRRLNLGLLDIAGKDGGRGVLVVDSTRRGKRFPDSLTKTIPIWIAVINFVLYPPESPSAVPELLTTPIAVSASEHSQISALLPGFVRDFMRLNLDLTHFKRQVPKPLRPIFVHPDSPLPLSPPEYNDFIPLVLVTASKMTKGEGMEGEYIQGAGDDHESWAEESRLDPELFWRHANVILGCRDEELPQLVEELRKADRSTALTMERKATLIKPTSNIFLGSVTDLGKTGEGYRIIVNCGKQPFELQQVSEISQQKKVLELGLPPGKLAVKKIRSDLEGKLESIQHDLEHNHDAVFVCETGDTIAPVVALAVLCLFYDEKGRFQPRNDSKVDKEFIRRRLAWISAARQSSNPPRTLLNALNSVLMKY